MCDTFGFKLNSLLRRKENKHKSRSKSFELFLLVQCTLLLKGNIATLTLLELDRGECELRRVTFTYADGVCERWRTVYCTYMCPVSCRKVSIATLRQHWDAWASVCVRAAQSLWWVPTDGPINGLRSESADSKLPNVCSAIACDDTATDGHNCPKC